MSPAPMYIVCRDTIRDNIIESTRKSTEQREQSLRRPPPPSRMKGMSNQNCLEKNEEVEDGE